jgi:hypothetical protein
VCIAQVAGGEMLGCVHRENRWGNRATEKTVSMAVGSDMRLARTNRLVLLF